jgi:hypothetical protein
MLLRTAVRNGTRAEWVGTDNLVQPGSRLHTLGHAATRPPVGSKRSTQQQLPKTACPAAGACTASTQPPWAAVCLCKSWAMVSRAAKCSMLGTAGMYHTSCWRTNAAPLTTPTDTTHSIHERPPPTNTTASRVNELATVSPPVHAEGQVQAPCICACWLQPCLCKVHIPYPVRYWQHRQVQHAAVEPLSWQPPCTPSSNRSPQQQQQQQQLWACTAHGRSPSLSIRCMWGRCTHTSTYANQAACRPTPGGDPLRPL